MARWLKVEDIEAYQAVSGLSDELWGIVSRWDWFSKRTLRVQWVNAVDSIAANIAEGFGRSIRKISRNFTIMRGVRFTRQFIGLKRHC